MAQAGDLINYTNYVALDGSSSWRNTLKSGNDRGTNYYYVSAPAFYFYYIIEGTGWWGYQEGSCAIYPYDESTGAFSATKVFGSSKSGRGGSYDGIWQWKHNKDGGSSGDVHDCHLWKISVYMGNNDGNCSMWIYTGGLSHVKEDLYADYFQKRYIYCSEGKAWKKGTGTDQYASDEAFLQAQYYTHMRGTPISISTGTYKYITSKPL